VILNLDKNSDDNEWIPPQYPKKRPNAICCPNCGKDTGLENPFYMVIPPGGLKCACGTVVINSASYMMY